MSMVIFFVLVALCIGISIYKNMPYVNPLTAFACVWGGITLLYQLRLSGLQAPLSSRMYAVLSVMLLSFLAFFLLSASLGKRLHKRKKNHRQSKGIEIPDRIFWIHMLVWIVVSVVEIVYSGGMPIIWILTGSAKTYLDFGIPTVHGLFIAYGLVIALVAYTKLLRNGRRRSLTYVAALSLILLYYLLLISRQVIISAIIEMVIAHVVIKKNVSWKKIVLLILCGIVAFGAIGNLRTGYDAFMTVAQLNPDLPRIFSGLYWIYMYLTMTLANLNNLVLMPLVHSGLQPILEFCLPTVLVDAIFPMASESVAPYLVSINFNVSGFIDLYYVGLGFAGVVLAGALYGGVSGFVFSLFEAEQSDRNILLYAVTMQIVLLSFFVDMLLYLPNGFQLVIVALMYLTARIQMNSSGQRKAECAIEGGRAVEESN